MSTTAEPEELRREGGGGDRCPADPVATTVVVGDGGFSRSDSDDDDEEQHELLDDHADDEEEEEEEEEELGLLHQHKRRRRRRPRPPSSLLFLVLLLAAAAAGGGRRVPVVVEAASALGGGGHRISSSTVVRSRRPTTISKKKKKPKTTSTTPSELWTWGNFGHEPEPLTPSGRIGNWIRRRIVDPILEEILRKRLEEIRSSMTVLGSLKLIVRAGRAWVFWHFSKDCLSSIYEDNWHAERDPDAFFGSEGMWISKGAHKDVVRRRIQRSKRNRQWVGLGYTPRLVWLVGVVLRGTFQCTAIPKVFNPSLTGWGAGTILGAKCTHQEWIASFMLGWFGSEYYWRFLFGCDGPPFAKPGFVGVPVFITKLRIL